MCPTAKVERVSAPLGHPDNPAPRSAGRVLLLDPADRVLMFQGTDPAIPGLTYWFTAGGGRDDGETTRQAAARELLEEAGIVVEPAELGEPVWHQVTSFSYDSYWYRQEQDFFLYRTTSVEVSLDGQDEIERASIVGFRWWSVAELEETTESIYPEELPQLLRELLGA